MKVYIDGKIYTCQDSPIVVNLSEEDKKNIAAMDKDATCYMVYADKGMSMDEAIKFFRKAKVRMEEVET